jgi:hypothetical protein
MLIFTIIKPMKQLLPALFLLVTAFPLFANDEGGDGPEIPSYRELVREGYGPSNSDRSGYYVWLNYNYHMAPKPTQAYYGRGYTVYYGYTAVPVAPGQADTIYAFGYPLSYFRSLMPASVNETNIANYAVEVRNTSYYEPGEYVTQRGSNHANAVTAVRKVSTRTVNTAAAPATTLPPIGEKPPQ